MIKFKNKLNVAEQTGALEARVMLMAATPETFTGFLGTGDSDPSFEDILDGRPRATGSQKANNPFIDLVNKNQIDDRGTRYAIPSATAANQGKSGTGERAKISRSQLTFHNPFGVAFNDGTKSSRWYQEQGNTQIFRVFPGDQNWVGERQGAPRSEAVASSRSTVFSDGKTMTFSGRFNVAEHNGSRDVMLFQSKATGKNTAADRARKGGLETPAWGIAMFAQADGDIILKRRLAKTVTNDQNNTRQVDDVIDTGKNVGESFNLRVNDDGLNYEAFIDNKSVAKGQWERGNARTVARWGNYVQANSADRAEARRERRQAGGILTGDEPQVVLVSGADVSLS